jgi:two-component system, OmpR family, response regulator RegX3
MRFAIVDASASQATVLKALLISEGHEVEVFPEGQACLDASSVRTFDGFVLDWTLPATSCKALLQYIRSDINWNASVIVCAAHATEEDVADVLSLGADDFMPKPIRYMEFMARIEALSRHHKTGSSAPLCFGNFELDLKKKRVLRSGLEITLTQTEYELAQLFFQNISRVFSREELIRDIWQRHPDIDSRTVDTHTSRIRKKLGLDGQNGFVLSSVYGKGYRLDSVR